jgi:hypothetical protein
LVKQSIHRKEKDTGWRSCPARLAILRILCSLTTLLCTLDCVVRRMGEKSRRLNELSKRQWCNHDPNFFSSLSLSLLMSEMSLCRVDKGSIIHLEASSHGGRQDNVWHGHIDWAQQMSVSKYTTDARQSN